MESTLFTTLTANEEANFCGGNKSSKKETAKVSLIKYFFQFIAQFTGGAGGAGIINIGSGDVVVIGSTVIGGDGGSNAIVTSRS
ncbi:MAG: hypothetical protein ACYTXA_04595 [Nostoc sp.]